MKISMNIVQNTQDAEESVNDAYLGAWNAIPPDRPDPLFAYVCRLVRNISINRYKYNNACKRKSNYGVCIEELEYCLGTSTAIDDGIEESMLTSYINEFLDGKKEVNCMIFVRRFWYMDSYKDIAKASKINEGTIRVRVLRIKSDLKSFLIEKGVIM